MGRNLLDRALLAEGVANVQRRRTGELGPVEELKDIVCDCDVRCG